MARSLPLSSLRALLAVVVVASSAVPRLARADTPTDVAEAARKEATALAERLKSKDPAELKAALGDAAKHQHPLVTTALCRLVGDVEGSVRDALAAALVGRTELDGRKAAARAIEARVERIQKSDDDLTERIAWIGVLHDLAQPSSLRVLAAETGLDRSADELAARLRAIANLPSADAIEAIIQFRSSGNRRGQPDPTGAQRGRLARDAFRYATGVDVGHDPDAMRAWWKDHAKTFDFDAAAERRAKEGGGPGADGGGKGKGKGKGGEKTPPPK